MRISEAQKAAYQPSGNGTTGQVSPLSFAALGSGAFGDGRWGAVRSAIMATRTSLEWTCQNLARAFELCPVVISCIGTPFWVACLQSDPLSKKKLPRQCLRPPNVRQNAALRQTVHVSLAVAVAVLRPAAMEVARVGAAKARPRAHSPVQHRFPANQEMPCLPV